MNMKSMMKQFYFSPAEVKNNIQNEGMTHKKKIILFSIAMAASSSWYQSYFDNLVYRSQQF